MAIVGGGPAGSVAAAMLAQRGVRVVLIDGSHPREKRCGGGYTGRALALMEPLLPVSSLRATRVQRAVFMDTPRRRQASVDLTNRDNTLLVASRSETDRALFDGARRAGASTIQARVTRIAPGQPHTITVDRGAAITASFVIGADGANSLVRRTFAQPFRRSQLSVATGFYAHGVTSDAVVIELVDRPAGYIWSFPRPDHLAIGICAQADDTTVDAVRHKLVAWMRDTQIATGARLEPYSWPIPSLDASDFAQMEFGGESWVTVGDAAGLVDPITREGIFFALQSATVAAEAFVSNPGSASAIYAERVRDEIVGELALAARLKAGFFRTGCSRLLLDALMTSGRIREVMADLVAGTQPYRTLRRRLLSTFELRLAWTWWRSAQRTA